MQRLRYGIVGCGSMGREHILNILALGGGDVVALADPHPPSLAAAQALLADAARPVAVHAQAQALFEAGGLDAIVIAAPNFLHHDLVVQALATEAHLLVEKPLCTTVADALDLVQRAQGRRALVWVAQEYRYMPPVAELVRLAHEGSVGRLRQVAIREHREPFYPKVGDWNRFNANTGGTLVEKCCHYFNLMDLILRDKPLRVFASGAQDVNHRDERYGGRAPDILDNAYVVVDYAGGARALLDLCMFAENSLDNEHVCVVGDEGKLESLLPSGVLRHGRREDWGRRDTWGQPSGTARGVAVRQIRDTNIRYLGQHFGASYVEHERFAAAIRAGRGAEVTLEEGLRSIATGLAAQRSIAEGRVVALSELLPPGW